MVPLVEFEGDMRLIQAQKQSTDDEKGTYSVVKLWDTTVGDRETRQ